MERFKIDGKIAIVTGATGLLGPTWTQALLEAGATVIGIDLLNASKNKNFTLLQEKYTKEKLALFHGDITKKEELIDILAQIKKDYDPISILVNNAGIDQPPTSSQEKFTIEQIPFEINQKILDVNILGTFNCIQVFGSEMKKNNQGSIINIGSLYATFSPDESLYDHIEGFLKPPLYGASKAAVINLTKQIAAYWGKYNIRINTLSPGGVFNNQDPVFIRKFCQKTPLQRMANHDDLVGPLIFLASDASRYITGQNININGGYGLT